MTAVFGMLESLPTDLLQCIVEMADWPLEIYCQFIGISHTLRTKIRGTGRDMDFECPRDDLNDASTPDDQRYAPVLRPDTLVALMAPCQNTLRSLALPSGRSLTGCGCEEASFAGWVDAAFGGGLGGTLRSLTIRSLEGLSSGALRRMLGHLPALEHFGATFLLPDEGAPAAVLAMLCPACPHLRTIRFGTVRPSSRQKGSPGFGSSFSCAPLAGCPELVELTLGDIPADVASLNTVLLPRLHHLQVLQATQLFGRIPVPLNFSQLPHPDRLLRATSAYVEHLELLTGLEEFRGCVPDGPFGVLTPHLRRIAIPQPWNGLPLVMPHLVEFEGQFCWCPLDAWERLERATLYITDRVELRLVAPRLRHLALLRGPGGTKVAPLKCLDAPVLESLDLMVKDGIGEVALHCPLLRSMTLRDFTGRPPPLPWCCSGERFDQLRSLTIIEQIWPDGDPMFDPETVRAALSMAPNLTTLKGIALTDPAHLPLLADLCSGSLLPHLAHLDVITNTGKNDLKLQCSSPGLRVLALRLSQALPRRLLRVVGPGLIRLQLGAKRMPPLAIEAPRLRACRLEAPTWSPSVCLETPALRRLSLECHDENLTALSAALVGLPALCQLRLVVPWLPAVVPRILATAAPSRPLIDLTLLVRGQAKTVPLDVTLPPWVRSLVLDKALEVRLQGGAGLESIDLGRATKLCLSAEGSARPNLARVTRQGHIREGMFRASPLPGLSAGCRVVSLLWQG
ncbi:hypothetical protein PAPYR_3558 [Paratrimastix pyriformis]|uniref:F-box domain-containing protein n=1 Tax=Paratrimastix pyriformis TaxID=342808 RepID=A0ABQ8UTW8_9EUKA|nr:hypothetical protein PAPYR_3558 [Paratrimastix pyriformis]